MFRALLLTGVISLVSSAKPIFAQLVTVHGMVTDSLGAPVQSASVQVTEGFWHASTGSDGAFELRILPGTWRLSVRRIGYGAAERLLTVTADEPTDALTIVLRPAPGVLSGIYVTDDRDAPFGATITPGNVRQIPPLGEPDIFRLLPMLPGVSQANDLLGRVHLAGGASDEHRVTLDGHPLQSPFHVLSVLGAFNVAALDHAGVLMHHLGPEHEGALSGIVGLETKAGDRHVREATISILSASMTAAQPNAFLGTDVLASGRVTYLDRILRSVTNRTGASDDAAAPGFRDGLLKIHRSFDHGWSAEALAYASADYWSAAQARPGSISPRWGEQLFGAHVRREGRSTELHVRLSSNRSFVQAMDSIDDPISNERMADFVDVTQHWSSVTIDGALTGTRLRARAGVTFDYRRHADSWSGTKASEWFTQRTPDTLERHDAQTRAGTFGELTLLGRRTSVAVGGHVSVVRGISYVAPRIALGAGLRHGVHVEVAADRRYQFDAVAEEPIEGTVAQPVYLLDMPRRADVLALSGTWRDSKGSAGSASAGAVLFARRYHDRTTLIAPASAEPTFPVFQRSGGETLGASLTGQISARNGATLQGSYTIQSARESIEGRLRPTSWDAPHTLSAFGAYPISADWMLTTAFQFHSGTAITPVASRILIPLGGGRYSMRFIYGEPNSARLAAYQRVDFGVRRSFDAWQMQWMFTAQVLNVFNRVNALSYYWPAYFACAGTASCGPDAITARQGLPILPSIGLEVRW